VARGPEAEFQKQVLHTAELYGWEWYHPPDVDPRRVGGTPYKPGWLDLTLAKESVGRVLFVELKVDGNYPTPDQKKWMRRLDAAGLEVGLWYPRDLRTTVVRTLGPRQERLVLPVRYRSESHGNIVLTRRGG
jgi:hypothetical protein